MNTPIRPLCATLREFCSRFGSDGQQLLLTVGFSSRTADDYRKRRVNRGYPSQEYQGRIPCRVGFPSGNGKGLPGCPQGIQLRHNPRADESPSGKETLRCFTTASDPEAVRQRGTVRGVHRCESELHAPALYALWPCSFLLSCPLTPPARRTPGLETWESLSTAGLVRSMPSRMLKASKWATRHSSPARGSELSETGPSVPGLRPFFPVVAERWSRCLRPSMRQTATAT